MQYAQAADALKAIGEETRLKIVAYLTIDTFCVCELVALLDMSQPSISQHMKRLKDTEIVHEEKRGKWTYYHLNEQHECYEIIVQLTKKLPAKTDKVTALLASGKRVSCD